MVDDSSSESVLNEFHFTECTFAMNICDHVQLDLVNVQHDEFQLSLYLEDYCISHSLLRRYHKIKHDNFECQCHGLQGISSIVQTFIDH